jgi:hypothetical protein
LAYPLRQLHSIYMDGDEMTGETPSFDDYVEISAKVLGFSMKPSWKRAASANMETIFKMAAAIESFELPEELEPAPVFEA